MTRTPRADLGDLNGSLVCGPHGGACQQNLPGYPTTGTSPVCPIGFVDRWDPGRMYFDRVVGPNLHQTRSKTLLHVLQVVPGVDATSTFHRLPRRHPCHVCDGSQANENGPSTGWWHTAATASANEGHALGRPVTKHEGTNAAHATRNAAVHGAQRLRMHMHDINLASCHPTA